MIVEDDLGVTEPLTAITCETQIALAPKFDKPEEIRYVWYSWHERYPYWSKSCWEGKTMDEAIEAVERPSAIGMRSYGNVLVREHLCFEVVSAPPLSPDPMQGILEKSEPHKAEDASKQKELDEDTSGLP